MTYDPVMEERSSEQTLLLSFNHRDASHVNSPGNEAVEVDRKWQQNDEHSREEKIVTEDFSLPGHSSMSHDSVWDGDAVQVVKKCCAMYSLQSSY